MIDPTTRKGNLAPVDRQVHGEDAVSQGLVERITLPTLGAFRDFTNEAIADVMYYLTPKQVAERGVLPFSCCILNG